MALLVYQFSRSRAPRRTPVCFEVATRTLACLAPIWLMIFRTFEFVAVFYWPLIFYIPVKASPVFNIEFFSLLFSANQSHPPRFSFSKHDNLLRQFWTLFLAVKDSCVHSVKNLEFMTNSLCIKRMPAFKSKARLLGCLFVNLSHIRVYPRFQF